MTYKYHVQAVISSSVKSAGAPSPSLFYTPKRGFCGDGKVDEKNGEECDDGNVRDGDGCNVRCKKEDVFHCKGLLHIYVKRCAFICVCDMWCSFVISRVRTSCACVYRIRCVCFVFTCGTCVKHCAFACACEMSCFFV